MYMLSHVKQTAGGKLLCNREPSLAPCDDREQWSGGAEEDPEGRDACVIATDSD